MTGVAERLTPRGTALLPPLVNPRTLTLLAPNTDHDVWQDWQVTHLTGQQALITNRHRLLDRDRYGHVPLRRGPHGEKTGFGYAVEILAAELDGDAIRLTVAVPDEIADDFEAASTGWVYLGYQIGIGQPVRADSADAFGRRVTEVGLSPAPDPLAKARRLILEAQDASEHGRRELDRALALRGEALAAMPDGTTLALGQMHIERVEGAWWDSEGIPVLPTWVEDYWLRQALVLVDDEPPAGGAS